jgi:hypothetical protein
MASVGPGGRITRKRGGKRKKKVVFPGREDAGLNRDGRWKRNGRTGGEGWDGNGRNELSNLKRVSRDGRAERGMEAGKKEGKGRQGKETEKKRKGKKRIKEVKLAREKGRTVVGWRDVGEVEGEGEGKR